MSVISPAVLVPMLTRVLACTSPLAWSVSRTSPRETASHDMLCASSPLFPKERPRIKATAQSRPNPNQIRFFLSMRFLAVSCFRSGRAASAAAPADRDEGDEHQQVNHAQADQQRRLGDSQYVRDLPGLYGDDDRETGQHHDERSHDVADVRAHAIHS